MPNTICHSQQESILDGLAHRWREVVVFVHRDFRIAITYKLQFLFQFCQVFFGVAIIYFIGKMLGDSGESPLLKEYGADYFSFALVGLAVNSYCRAGLVNITNDIRQVMTQGTLEAICATPIGYTWLLLCSSLWQFVFETLRVLFYFLAGMLIFKMKLERACWLGGLVTIVLTIPTFLMLGVISCSILILVKRGDPINWIFSSISGLLAGTMFPVSVLPEWLQKVAFCLPLTHSLEAMRKSLLAGAPLSEIADHLAALILFAVLLAPATLLINHLCMRRAKQKGTFSTH